MSNLFKWFGSHISQRIHTIKNLEKWTFCWFYMNIFLIFFLAFTSSFYRLPFRQRDAVITSVRPSMFITDSGRVPSREGDIQTIAWIFFWFFLAFTSSFYRLPFRQRDAVITSVRPSMFITDSGRVPSREGDIQTIAWFVLYNGLSEFAQNMTGVFLK